MSSRSLYERWCSITIYFDLLYHMQGLEWLVVSNAIVKSEKITYLVYRFLIISNSVSSGSQIVYHLTRCLVTNVIITLLVHFTYNFADNICWRNWCVIVNDIVISWCVFCCFSNIIGKLLPLVNIKLIIQSVGSNKNDKIFSLFCCWLSSSIFTAFLEGVKYLIISSPGESEIV